MYGSWDMEWDTAFFVILNHFLDLLPPSPPNNRENQNIEKIKKESGDITIYQNVWLGDVQFLRYGAHHMDGWIDEQKSDI